MVKLLSVVGKRLVWILCGYEWIALSIEQFPIGQRMHPLSFWCHRYRLHPIGTPLIGGLLAWLGYHLLLEPLNAPPLALAQRPPEAP